MIETAEGVSVAGIGHVSDLVGTQDVGGEAADAGHDAEVLAHPTGMFSREVPPRRMANVLHNPLGKGFRGQGFSLIFVPSSLR